MEITERNEGLPLDAMTDAQIQRHLKSPGLDGELRMAIMRVQYEMVQRKAAVRDRARLTLRNDELANRCRALEGQLSD